MGQFIFTLGTLTLDGVTATSLGCTVGVAKLFLLPDGRLS